MKSLIPVLILGAVLAAFVFGARCSQNKMHEIETRRVEPTKDGVATDPNSSPSDLAERERAATQFPDTLLSTTGLRFKVLREGTGEKPIAGSRVKVHYTGRFFDGTVFDTSEGGKPYEFTVLRGHVIRGWDSAVLDMRKGEKRLVVIPSSHAYGVMGKPPKVPTRATLIFEMELVDFE